MAKKKDKANEELEKVVEELKSAFDTFLDTIVKAFDPKKAKKVIRSVKKQVKKK